MKVFKATKKPVTIEAVHLTDSNIKAAYAFMYGDVSINSLPISERWDTYEKSVREKGMTINTLEGEMRASIGNYIIKGVNGEFYPCKPDIFEKTYDY